jgi:hypothetical protein
MTDTVVTSVGFETWATGTGPARVTTVAREVWFSTIPAAVVSTVAREVWIPATTGRKRRGLVLATS